MKCVYKAPTEEAALNSLEDLKEKWDFKYSMVIDSWYNNWDKLSTYFNYSPEIRKIIYTTYTEKIIMPIFSAILYPMRISEKYRHSFLRSVLS